MPAVGGSIESIAIKGRPFPVASDSDVNRKLGGFENAVNANGDGTARMVKTRVPWSLSGINVEIDDTRGDHEFLQEIADGKDYVPLEITLVSGITWSGRGTISDAIEYSTTNAYAGITLSGPQALEQQ